MITGNTYILFLLKITFYRKWLPPDVHDCTFGTEIAKLCHCSLHGIHIVATSSRMCAYIFRVINHSGISFLLAYSSESVQNVAVVRHQLTTSWGINVLRQRACMTLTWQQRRVCSSPEVIN